MIEKKGAKQVEECGIVANIDLFREVDKLLTDQRYIGIYDEFLSKDEEGE